MGHVKVIGARGVGRSYERVWVMERELNGSARQALSMFADEVSAYCYLERVLWPDGVSCPHCGSSKVGQLNGASTRLGTRKCYGCRKTFSILHSTLMSGSHVPPHKWLQAMYLTEGGAKPMRPQHLCRILNVSFKTAGSMMRRIVEAGESRGSASAAKTPSLAALTPSVPARSARAAFAAWAVSIGAGALETCLRFAEPILSL